MEAHPKGCSPLWAPKAMNTQTHGSTPLGMLTLESTQTNEHSNPREPIPRDAHPDGNPLLQMFTPMGTQTHGHPTFASTLTDNHFSCAHPCGHPPPWVLTLCTHPTDTDLSEPPPHQHPRTHLTRRSPWQTPTPAGTLPGQHPPRPWVPTPPSTLASTHPPTWAF